MNLAELRAERAKHVARMRAINDAAGETRSLTTEEDAEYRRLEAEVDRIEAELKEAEGREARATKLAALEAGLQKTDPPASGKAAPTTEARTDRPGLTEKQLVEGRAILADFLRGRLSAEQAEQRAVPLQISLFNKGGALQPPQEFVAELLRNVDNMVFVRANARIFSLPKAVSLGVPKLDTDFTDATWTTELLTGDEDDLTFGKRELYPHPIAKLVKASNTLVRQSAIPVDALVRDRMQYVFGVTLEKGYLTGSGFQQPLGIFTASANGVPTTQDVSTDNTSTSITFDGLINAKHFMKAQYWPSARWVFHRDAVKQIRKLKDGEGQYLWQPAVGAGAGLPDRILDLPYDTSEYAPNTFTTGQYVGALAVWQNYWIADALDMSVQVLAELYAATNQIGYIGRFESDGMPVLAESFVRVKLG
jgi:HK97 family phage major capsid protein